MAQFEKLQELWQGQAGPAVSAGDIAKLTRSLQAYNRRQNWVIGAKAVLVSSVLAWCFTQGPRTAPAFAGILLVAVVAAAMLVTDWRNQRAVARLDFAAPSLGFIRGAIERLMARRDPFRWQQWPFLGSLVLGMNLVLGGSHRFWLRVAFSTLPIGAYQLGMWVRRRRFEAECRPLLAQLTAMQSALEERPE